MTKLQVYIQRCERDEQFDVGPPVNNFEEAKLLADRLEREHEEWRDNPGAVVGADLPITEYEGTEVYAITVGDQNPEELYWLNPKGDWELFAYMIKT